MHDMWDEADQMMTDAEAEMAQAEKLNREADRLQVTGKACSRRTLLPGARP